MTAVRNTLSATVFFVETRKRDDGDRPRGLGGPKVPRPPEYIAEER